MNEQPFPYPGIPGAVDGNTAAILSEREASDAAGAFPITPSTQMGEYWEAQASAGHLNVSGEPLIFIEPEGEHAAAGVTAGLSMSGLRSANFSSGQGIAYMHESLYAAVGKRLTYVLNMGCRAMTKASLNVHAGHDDYHAADDTGFFQLFAKNVQQVADLNLIAHRVAEWALTPGIIAQDGFLTTHLIESLRLPERELVAEFLGRPADLIATPTASQRMIFGKERRRVPMLWDVDNPVLIGPVQNQDSYMQQVAAQNPHFFQPILGMVQQAMEQYYRLTGRRYQPVETYRVEDAEYLLMGQGSVIPSCEAVADFLREKKGLKVGVINLTLFRPFPGAILSQLIRGAKGVTVLERVDQPLAEDLPMIRELRAALYKGIENGMGHEAFAGYAAITPGEIPPLYSACFGLGSRDLQPEGLIGAVENMLDKAPRKKRFYLSIDFIKKPTTPKQEIYFQQLKEQIPNLEALSVHGSENPNLMPKGSITVRFHSIGGWGAMATGKALTMTLADILGFYVKSNPKYGSEKKGQPTTYYLAVAPEPIRVNCEFYYVDSVISPDPNVFSHPNPLGGLRQGGTFILQSDLGDSAKVWASLPAPYAKMIVNQEIRFFYLDAFKIAREEAHDPDLLFRMQGMACQGAFFKATGIAQQQGLDEAQLFERIEQQLRAKFKGKGEQVIQDNLQVVKRGYFETHEITEKPLELGQRAEKKSAELPMALKARPQANRPVVDIHRFWEQTGYFYKQGTGGGILADPFAGMSLIPAGTGIFKDLTEIRFEHPRWVPANCTGCGKCWGICPDSAIPGLVSRIDQLFETAAQRLESKGLSLEALRPQLRALEKDFRARLVAAENDADVIALLKASVAQKNQPDVPWDDFLSELAHFPLALTQPYFRTPENQTSGAGGLLSVTINPLACKGCMECVALCGDQALVKVPQSPATLESLHHSWAFWNDLPTTDPRYIRVDNLEEAVGALESILLDKAAYQSMTGGDGACLGCAEKSLLHLFTSTVVALMDRRVRGFLAHLDQMIEDLLDQARQRTQLDLNDSLRLEAILSGREDLSLEELAHQLGPRRLDLPWLSEVNRLRLGLMAIRDQYLKGDTGLGRAQMGIVNATGCSSVWGSTYPINPYPFPWVNHLFQDSPSIALGVFEGHMRKMAGMFKQVRQAQAFLDAEEPPDLTYFDWRQFSDEEMELSPPVVVVGGDGAMYDIGFQNLSRLMMTGKPIKVVVLDTQVYSNTGGQACTSGFKGQTSDMATFGKLHQGKEEVRKELALIAMAHRTTYVLQGSMANPSHLVEGFIAGLKSRRPALFNLYTPCQPEHGIGDDQSAHQAKLALESRAYPALRFDPEQGESFAECLDLEGNPDPERDWPTYDLELDGEKRAIDLTFADFAATEMRFYKHFKEAPPETWDDGRMVPLVAFLDLADPGERVPYIWAKSREGKARRLLVSAELVDSTRDRRRYWRLLRSLAESGREAAQEQLAEQLRRQMAQELTEKLLALASS
ncbi:MAG: 2-oxoacid:acceptor oxidoreductase family protein [bacterium]|nr:2-oxoacid:acceptor oxidoreductase family protein [bacterium]